MPGPKMAGELDPLHHPGNRRQRARRGLSLPHTLEGQGTPGECYLTFGSGAGISGHTVEGSRTPGEECSGSRVPEQGQRKEHRKDRAFCERQGRTGVGQPYRPITSLPTETLEGATTP